MAESNNPKFTAAVREAWPELADQILAVIRGEAWREDPAVVAWAAKCHHDPRESRDARAECRMVALNRIMDGCGVEVIRGRWVDRYHGDIQAAYVNFGDTYDLTILLDHERQTWRVTSWGDWVEANGDRREVA